MTACGDEAGSAAANAEIRKCHKYQDIICGVDFVPVAIETSGAWGTSHWSDQGDRSSNRRHHV